MSGAYPECLPEFPKTKKHRTNFIYQWVSCFKKDSHFDTHAIPILSVKKLNNQYKSSELCSIYKLLQDHLQYAKDNNLMRNAVPTLHSLAHIEKLQPNDDKASSFKKSFLADVYNVEKKTDGVEDTPAIVPTPLADEIRNLKNKDSGLAEEDPSSDDPDKASHNPPSAVRPSESPLMFPEAGLAEEDPSSDDPAEASNNPPSAVRPSTTLLPDPDADRSVEKSTDDLSRTSSPHKLSPDEAAREVVVRRSNRKYRGKKGIRGFRLFK